MTNDGEDVDLLEWNFAEFDAHAATEWRQRECPPPARMWEVGFGQASFTGDERIHVRDCRECQIVLASIERAVAARRSAVEELATARATVAMILVRHVVARELLFRQRCTDRFASQDESPQIIAFDGDSDFVGSLEQTDRGPRLRLEHRTLPPETLLRVQLADPEAPAQTSPTVWVMLRDGYPHSEAVLLLDNELPGDGAPRKLEIETVGWAKAVPETAAQVLREGFARAGRDDPAAVAAWQRWASHALEDERPMLPGPIHSVLTDIVAGPPIEGANRGKGFASLFAAA